MRKQVLILQLLIILIIPAACQDSLSNITPVPGAVRLEMYIDKIKNKSVAIVANQTSMIGDSHLVDVLLKEGVNVKAIFAPEHGFRDLADAGEIIEDGKDPLTGLPIISLYGDHHKPTPGDLQGVDIVIFDIQDVGARFYTYISTLHYLLEACAENNIQCLVLDRPNPNGFYVDGNVLDTAYRSFVGLDPVPVVHGMTPGEYAMMLNGEGWLANGIRCEVDVIKCAGYTHESSYTLPVKPSPNLPNQNSIYLYPSLCFFEGTNISVGRGTSFPFQVFGSPQMPDEGFSFIPESTGGAKNPPFLGMICYGKDLRNALTDGIVPEPELNLQWLIDAYNDHPDKDNFFIPYFDVLAGGPVLRQQITEGKSGAEIRDSWKKDLDNFKKIRDKYLLYE